MINRIFWVLSFYNGLYKFNKDGFSNFLPNPRQIESNANSVLEISPYDDSTFIVATDNNIFWFDGATFSESERRNRSLGVQFNTIGYAKINGFFLVIRMVSLSIAGKRIIGKFQGRYLLTMKSIKYSSTGSRRGYQPEGFIVL